jgi:hypothetical protein
MASGIKVINDMESELRAPQLSNQRLDPMSKSIGGRTGISAYNGINLPDYQDPYNVGEFQNSKYFNIASGDGMSPWSRLAAEMQNKLAAQKNAAAKANAQGVAAKTASSLAQQGGLTSGARERAQEQAGKNILSMVQGNNQEAANNIGEIGVEDAKQRMQMLGDATSKLTSMKSANVTGMNNYNQNTTEALNKAVAADQSAKAQVQAAQASNNDMSVILLVSSSLLGSLSPQEAKASEMLSQASKFTRLKTARKALGSEAALRGYCRFSDAISPKIESSLTGKKVALHALVKPLSKKGFISKVWSSIFSLLGKVA